MSRGFARLALVPLFCSLGCDSLSAHSFAGTVIQMSLAGTSPNGADEHFELWARNATNDIIRVNGIYDVVDPRTKKQLHSFFGFTIRPAITMGDQCMIDTKGNLLVSAAAYPTSVTFNGVPQTPEEQAAQVRARIGQLTTSSVCDGSGGDPRSHCGHESRRRCSAMVPWGSPFPPPAAYAALTFNSAPADRLAACNEYSQNPLAYTPNPAQLTAPGPRHRLGASSRCVHHHLPPGRLRRHPHRLADQPEGHPGAVDHHRDRPGRHGAGRRLRQPEGSRARLCPGHADAGRQQRRALRLDPAVRLDADGVWNRCTGSRFGSGPGPVLTDRQVFRRSE